MPSHVELTATVYGTQGSFIISSVKLGKLRLREARPPPTCEWQKLVSGV